jgi:adenylate cyclase
MIERTSRDLWFEVAIMEGDLTIGVAFVDLVDSTAWTASRSAADAAAALLHFEHAAVELATARGARVVKFVGDEVMVVAADPAAVAAVAVDLCRAAANDPQLPAARGAVGSGSVAPRGGDYYGEVVNLVSRATKVAAPHHVVATREVVDALDPSRWQVSALPPVRLRSIPGETELFTISNELYDE